MGVCGSKQQGESQAAVAPTPARAAAPASSTIQPYVPDCLVGAIFVGQTSTALGSIASSIGAAELYDGIPARGSTPNSEAKYCLQRWGVAVPDSVADLAVTNGDASICLVDHNEASQIHPSVPHGRVVGIIDRHALRSNPIVTKGCIHIDIRPWGSAASIVAHNFFARGRAPSVPVAGMLLSAIVSDTLNLKSPTTTDWDHDVVKRLVAITGLASLQDLASQQFAAKTAEAAGLSAAELVSHEQQCVGFKTDTFDGMVGFTVVETTDDDAILGNRAELCAALTKDKESKQLAVLFMAVVNVVTLRSHLIMCGTAEQTLGCKAFGDDVDPQKKASISPWVNNDNVVVPVAPASSTGAGEGGGGATGTEVVEYDDPNLLDLGGLFSSEDDLIPRVAQTINSGWSHVRATLIDSSLSRRSNVGTLRAPKGALVQG